MAEKEFNEITRAQHYNSHASGVECYAVIKHFNWALSSAVKYVWRAGMKDDSLKDLSKAVECLRREKKDRTELGKDIPETVLSDLRKVYEHEENYSRKMFIAHLERMFSGGRAVESIYADRLDVMISILEDWIREMEVREVFRRS
jgi:hypothetical protein